LPAEYKSPDTRRRLLATNHFFDLDAVVTKNRNLQKKTFFKEGNIEDEQRFSLKNFNLTDMAKYSSLTNSKNIGEAVLERVDLGVTKLDEKEAMEYNVDLNATQGVPFGKVGVIIIF
jgi:hypothetical protein